MHSIIRSMILLFISVLIFQQCDSNKPSHKFITADKVFEIINDSMMVKNYVLLDTRGRMDYIRGHLVSAFWLSPDSVESKIDLIAKETRPIIIYDAGDETISSRVCQILTQSGVTNFLVMDGGFLEWTRRGYPAAIQLVRNTSDTIDITSNAISATSLNELLRSPYSNYVIIDIRSYPSYRETHIPGAISIPYEPINEFVVAVEEHDFERNKHIVIYGDASSGIPDKAVEVMMRNDFSQVYLLRGGIGEWVSNDYPIDN